MISENTHFPKTSAMLKKTLISLKLFRLPVIDIFLKDRYLCLSTILSFRGKLYKPETIIKETINSLQELEKIISYNETILSMETFIKVRKSVLIAGDILHYHLAKYNNTSPKYIRFFKNKKKLIDLIWKEISTGSDYLLCEAVLEHQAKLLEEIPENDPCFSRG